MGWYRVPDIKNEEVVCHNPCDHRDCEANRKEWENAKCCDCGEPFTAGMSFYYKQTRPTIQHQCVGCALKEDNKS